MSSNVYLFIEKNQAKMPARTREKITQGISMVRVNGTLFLVKTKPHRGHSNELSEKREENYYCPLVRSLQTHRFRLGANRRLKEWK